MSKMLKSIHQEVQGLHRAGFVDDVTMRTFDMLCLRPVKQFGPAEIRALRERENVSQPVFALYLNVSKRRCRNGSAAKRNRTPPR
ncbi:transcriptional regulator [Serratia ureilytica]